MEGKSAYVAFQEIYWFDRDVRIDWFNLLLELYPDVKIGVIFDKSGS